MAKKGIKVNNIVDFSRSRTNAKPKAGLLPQQR